MKMILLSGGSTLAREAKDTSGPSPPNGGGISPLGNMFSFIEYLVQRGAYDLSAYVTLTYYRRVAPVFDAVDRIADEVAGIRPVIYDNTTEEFIETHPLLTLLNRPNPMQSGSEFMKAVAIYKLVTGNSYVTATGGMKRPPLELYTQVPTRVSITPDQIDGYAGTYSVASVNDSVKFNRVEMDGRFRYIDDDDMRELMHLRTFNPGDGIDTLYGMSKLTPVYYEIEQWINASIHNLSLLRNGATPSGVLSTEKNLTDDQYNRLNKEMEKYFMGPRNAGRPLIAEGGLEYSAMGMTNKDMDFDNLKKGIQDTLYSVLRIPLPMVSRAQMTLSNLDNSKYIFYDNAVLPMFNSVFDDLGDALMPRFKLDPMRYTLTYMPDEIPSLAARHMEETKNLNDMNKLTPNEVRARLGYGQVEGGDVLYQPSTNIPIGQDDDLSDEAATDEETQILNEDPPADDDEGGEDSGSSRKALAHFTKFMRKKVDAKGKRLYTDQKIATFAKKHGLLNLKKLKRKFKTP